MCACVRIVKHSKKGKLRDNVSSTVFLLLQDKLVILCEKEMKKFHHLLFVQHISTLGVTEGGFEFPVKEALPVDLL